MPNHFLYFDLGNVLLTFSNEQACEQMAEEESDTSRNWDADGLASAIESYEA